MNNCNNNFCLICNNLIDEKNARDVNTYNRGEKSWYHRKCLQIRDSCKKRKMKDTFEDIKPVKRSKKVKDFQISSRKESDDLRNSNSPPSKPYYFEEIKSSFITPDYKDLPIDRFSQTNQILLLRNSKAEQEIEKFVSKKLEDFNNRKNSPPLYITGPSGIGKSYALISYIINKRKMDEKMVIIHFICSYTNMGPTFLDSFINNLFYGLSIVKDDLHFPKRSDNLKYKTPFDDWMCFLNSDLMNKYEELIKFLKIVKTFLNEKNKKFIMILDQINTFHREYPNAIDSKEIPYNLPSFLNNLRRGFYFDLVIISASNTNESFKYIDNIEVKNCTLVINENFTESCSKDYFIHKNPDLTNDQILNLFKITGNNPLELYKFSENKNSCFEKKIKEYVNNRQNEIWVELSKFYINTMESKEERKKTFLLNYFALLDINMQVNDDYNNYIDKRYMYVNDKKYLKSVSPIAKSVLDFYYFEKLTKMNDSLDVNKSLINTYFDVFNNTADNNSLKGSLFEKIIILKLIYIVQTNLVLKLNYFNIQINDYDELNIKITKLKFFKENFKTLPNDDNNTLYLPLKFNNPHVDFCFYDATNKNLYVFQVTMNVISHAKSDTYFMNDFERIKIKYKKIFFIWITLKSLNSLKNIKKHFEIEEITKKKEPKESEITPKRKDSLIVFADEEKNIDIWKK